MGEIRDIDGNVVTPVGRIAPPVPAPMGRSGWKCLPCVVDRKMAEMSGAVELPALREAITMMGGQAVCYEHIVVQRQSPLLAAVPNGQVPPGMLNGH